MGLRSKHLDYDCQAAGEGRELAQRPFSTDKGLSSLSCHARLWTGMSIATARLSQRRALHGLGASPPRITPPLLIVTDSHHEMRRPS